MGIGVDSIDLCHCFFSFFNPFPFTACNFLVIFFISFFFGFVNILPK